MKPAEEYKKRLEKFYIFWFMEIDNYDDITKWSYSLASKWVQGHLVSKGVDTYRKFEQYKKIGGYLPKNFPRKPEYYFKKQGLWKGWGDFLGRENRKSIGELSRKNFMPYHEAVQIVRKAGINNCKSYREWEGRPKNLPARPDLTYKDQWPGWAEFCGMNFTQPKVIRYSKLTGTDVRIIKHQLNIGVSGSVLAKHFNVSEMQISRIRNGENWSDI
ncbi:MAG: hypothetical protein GVY19_13195 [Bacteroidetes bacterium]|nr:hypothetical protein [Bacteroidota bacterium]